MIVQGHPNGIPLPDNFLDVKEDLRPPGGSQVPAPNPHAQNAEGGPIRDKICTREAVEQRGCSGVRTSNSPVVGGANKEDVSLLIVELVIGFLFFIF